MVVIIEFNYMQYTENNIAVRYKDSSTDEWHCITIDIRTLGLLIENFGMIACEYNPYTSTRPNLDNGTTNIWAHVNYCGAPITIPCRQWSHDSTTVRAFLR